MRNIWSISESPGNNGFFVTSSANIQPILQISTAVEYILSPNRISGGRYHNVTICKHMCNYSKIVGFQSTIARTKVHTLIISKGRDICFSYFHHTKLELFPHWLYCSESRKPLTLVNASLETLWMVYEISTDRTDQWDNLTQRYLNPSSFNIALWHHTVVFPLNIIFSHNFHK